MNVTELLDARIKCVMNAIEITRLMLPAMCDTIYNVGGFEKHELEEIAKEMKLHLYTPGEDSMFPHYWVVMEVGNSKIYLRTNDYKKNTIWTEQ